MASEIADCDSYHPVEARYGTSSIASHLHGSTAPKSLIKLPTLMALPIMPILLSSVAAPWFLAGYPVLVIRLSCGHDAMGPDGDDRRTITLTVLIASRFAT